MMVPGLSAPENGPSTMIAFCCCRAAALFLRQRRRKGPDLLAYFRDTGLPGNQEPRKVGAGDTAKIQRDASAFASSTSNSHFGIFTTAELPPVMPRPPCCCTHEANCASRSKVM